MTGPTSLQPATNGEKEPAWSGQQWEYKIAYGAPDPNSIGNALTALGMEGWELVNTQAVNAVVGTQLTAQGIQQRVEAQMVLFLKRPKT